jgi:phage shock protein A
MDMLDFVTGPLRSLLGVAEATEAGIERHAPTAQLEARLDDAVAAVHRAADSMERHVAVVESLADSLPLTQSVTRLTDQLTELMKITAPVAAAEREVSRIERLFGRRGARAVPAAPRPPAADENVVPAPGEAAPAGDDAPRSSPL